MTVIVAGKKGRGMQGSLEMYVTYEARGREVDREVGREEESPI